MVHAGSPGPRLVARAMKIARALLKVGYRCNNNCAFCHAAPHRGQDAGTGELKDKIRAAAAIAIVLRYPEDIVAAKAIEGVFFGGLGHSFCGGGTGAGDHLACRSVCGDVPDDGALCAHSTCVHSRDGN